MKNGKATKSKETVPEVGTEQTEKSAAKKSAAVATDAEIAATVETTDGITPETFGTGDRLTPGDARFKGDLYGIVKGNPEVFPFAIEHVRSDLRSKYTDQQIENFLAGKGKKVLPTDAATYSLDRDKLVALAAKMTPEPAAEVPTEEETPELRTSATVEDFAVIEGESGIIEAAPSYVYAEDEPEPGTEELAYVYAEDEPDDDTKLMLEIIEDKHGSDAFYSTLAKKEKKLLDDIVSNKKFLAGLSGGDAGTWKSVKEAYDIFKNGGQEPIENFQKNPAALAKVEDDAIQGEPDLPEEPLTEDEKTRLAELESTIAEAKAAFDNAPKVMMRAMAEIRAGRLYRETHSSLEAYATERFGITRVYAQQLAQFGDVQKLLEESVPEFSESSVRAIQAIAVDTNKIAAHLGIEKSDFEAMAPIVKAVAQIVAEVSRDDDDKINVTGRTVQAVTEIVESVVKSGTVTIDGQDMTVEEAKRRDVLGLAVKSEIVHTVAENILTQQQKIMEQVKQARERRTEPHKAAEPKKLKPAAETFDGPAPLYFVSCTLHADKDDNAIANVFNAGFELACGCKFQKLTTSGEAFVCIEADGKPVKQ